MTRRVALPHHEPGNHRDVGRHRDPGQPVACAGLASRRSPRRLRRARRDRARRRSCHFCRKIFHHREAAPVAGSTDLPRRSWFARRRISSIDRRIAHRTVNHRQRMTVHRMRRSGSSSKLPIVRGQDEPATLLRQLQGPAESSRFLRSERSSRYLPRFSSSGMAAIPPIASPVAIHRGEDFQTRGAIELRKCDFQVLDRDRAIAEIEAHDDRAERSAIL